MRAYIQPSWIDAAADHNEWSGNNGQYRGDRSIEVPTFDKSGRPLIGNFSDEAIAARKKASEPKVKKQASIFDKIVPQQTRLSTLQQQLAELDSQRHTTDNETFYTYRAVLLKKIARQEQLVAKAMGWNQENTGSFQEENDETDSGDARVQGKALVKKSLKKDLQVFLIGTIVVFTAVMMIF